MAFVGSSGLDVRVSTGTLYSVRDFFEAVGKWPLAPIGNPPEAGGFRTTSNDSTMKPGFSEAEEPLHLRELWERGREHRIGYLAEQGMAENDIFSLVELVNAWLDDHELARLDSLSRNFAEHGLGAGELFGTWINVPRFLRLWIELAHSGLKDFDLAAGYALCHAATVASASYRADQVSIDTFPLVADGDHLD
jgi:hypothetical protein